MICPQSHFREIAELLGELRTLSPPHTCQLRPSLPVACAEGWGGASPEDSSELHPIPPTSTHTPQFRQLFLTAVGGGSRRLAQEAPSADTQDWKEIVLFISAESSRVYSHPRQWGVWCPFLEGVQQQDKCRALPPLPLRHCSSLHHTVRGQQETSWTQPYCTDTVFSGEYPGL